MARFVLDSDTISYILQRRREVLAQLAEAVRRNAQIFLCPIVYFQVRRGLLHKGAERQLRDFDGFALGLKWADFDRPMWDDAAQTWAKLRRRGRPYEDDADLLIAAYARRLRATLVTNNTRDFEDLDVPLANWLGEASGKRS